MLRMRKIGPALVLLGGLALVAACHGTSGPSKAAVVLKPLSVPDGSYTVGVPDGWDETFTKSPGWRSPSELELAAPGEKWPSQVTISVLRYAEAQMTPEKYLFDLIGQPGGGAEGLAVAGRTARAFDEKVERRPPAGMSGEIVPSLVRHVVAPAGRGFFVLEYDAPQSSAGKYRPVFEAVVASFTPADKDVPLPQDPISAKEYEVYAALFGVKAPGGLNSPQFFDAVPDGRLVFGTTIALGKPDGQVWPVEGFGPIDEALVKDYRIKNAKAWPLTDRIMVRDLAVLSPEELDARLSATREGSGDKEQGFSDLRDGLVSLSRVGFNEAGDLALLSAAHTTPGAMRAQYLVLMKKGASGWGLDKVVMEGLIYH